MNAPNVKTAPKTSLVWLYVLAWVFSSSLYSQAGGHQIPVNKSKIPALKDVPYELGWPVRSVKKPRHTRKNKTMDHTAKPRAKGAFQTSNPHQKLGFSVGFAGAGSAADSDTSSTHHASGFAPSNLSRSVLTTRGPVSPGEFTSSQLDSAQPSDSLILQAKDKSKLHAEAHYSFRATKLGNSRLIDGVWIQTGLGWQQNREDFSQSIEETNTLNFRSQGPRASLAVFVPFTMGSFSLNPGMGVSLSRLQHSAALFVSEGDASFSSEADAKASWSQEYRPELTAAYQIGRVQIEASVGYSISSESQKSVSFDSASQTAGAGTPLVSVENQGLDWTIEKQKNRSLQWGVGLKIGL